MRAPLRDKYGLFIMFGYFEAFEIRLRWCSSYYRIIFGDSATTTLCESSYLSRFVISIDALFLIEREPF